MSPLYRTWIVLSLLTLLAMPIVAIGENVKLSTPETYDVFNWEVGPNGKGTITVYLQSSGDALDGYIVELVDLTHNRSLGTKTSDPSGEISYSSIKAGSYRVYLRRTPKQARASSVKIGDFRFAVDEGKLP